MGSHWACKEIPAQRSRPLATQSRMSGQYRIVLSRKSPCVSLLPSFMHKVVVPREPNIIGSAELHCERTNIPGEVAGRKYAHSLPRSRNGNLISKGCVVATRWSRWPARGCSFASRRGRVRTAIKKPILHLQGRLLIWCPRPDSNRHAIAGEGFSSHFGFRRRSANCRTFVGWSTPSP